MLYAENIEHAEGQLAAIWTCDGRDITGTVVEVTDSVTRVECTAENGSVTTWTIDNDMIIAVGVASG